MAQESWEALESGPGSGLTWAGMGTVHRASKPGRNRNEGVGRK